VNAPAWLPPILAVVMLLVTAYCLWRIAVARLLEAGTDYANDAAVALLALATAGMLVHWMHVLTPGIWAALLAVAALATLVVSTPRPRRAESAQASAKQQTHAQTQAQTGPTSRPGHVLTTAAGCGIGIYMLLAGVAPSTISGSTAGYYTMAGMTDMYKDTTITFPAVGIVFAVVLAGYAVIALDGTSRSASTAEPSGADSTAARPALAPRSITVCQVALAVVMAYAILAKLV
jgi:hypothetical protein